MSRTERELPKERKAGPRPHNTKGSHPDGKGDLCNEKPRDRDQTCLPTFSDLGGGQEEGGTEQSRQSLPYGACSTKNESRKVDHLPLLPLRGGKLLGEGSSRETSLQGWALSSRSESSRAQQARKGEEIERGGGRRRITLL